MVTQLIYKYTVIYEARNFITCAEQPITRLILISLNPTIALLLNIGLDITPPPPIDA
jgi:hypothetical protein